MYSKEGKKNLSKEIFAIAVCALLGFIAITISCKNSFLYSFNDSSDIQTFVTTSRCMLRGDVLYRDVFDVKGPLLYFFYMLGLLIDSTSFHGIFLLESILFMMFSVLCYFIAGLYIENNILRILVSGISSFVSTTSVTFFGGGQCEDLLLPILALVIYIVLRYFRKDYPKRIEWYKTIIIGICAAIIVWVKYTIAGIFGGIVLYVIFLQIKEKKWKDMWIYAGEFLIGFLIGSIPTFVYFGMHNAFGSLFEVYFYDLIFSYKEPTDAPTHFLTNNFYIYFIGASALAAFAFVYPILDGGRHLNKQERGVIPLMVFFMGIGLSFGRLWLYTPECMQVFVPLGAVGAIYSIMDCWHRMPELLRKSSCAVERILTSDLIQKKYYLALIAVILLLLNTDIFLIPIVVIFGAILLVRMLQRYLTPLIQKNHKLIVIKYLLFLIIYYICTMKLALVLSSILSDKDNALAFKYFGRLTILLSGLADYRLFAKDLSQNVTRKVNEWKAEYIASRRKINIILGIMSLALYTFYCYSLSKSSYDIGSSVEDKPQYRIAQYIENSGIEHPIVMYYKDIDFGYYWLTKTYPETRFSCDFNIKLPELNELYEEYIDGGKADFIITSASGEGFEFPGYSKAYGGQSVYVDGVHTMQFVLWEKDEK